MNITRKQLLHVGLLLIIAPFAGCTEPITKAKDSGCSHRKVYGYQHHETTGLTDSVYIGEREQVVQFATDSDIVALNRLRGLLPDVLFPLSDGKHLFVVGDLHRKELWTPGGANRATKESYRDFRLHDWYIVAPFEEWRSREDFEKPEIVRRNELRITNFDARTTSDLKFEPSRYQKTSNEHRLYMTQFAE